MPTLFNHGSHFFVKLAHIASDVLRVSVGVITHAVNNIKAASHVLQLAKNERVHAVNCFQQFTVRNFINIHKEHPSVVGFAITTVEALAGGVKSTAKALRLRPLLQQQPTGE
jgi:hypothetical protein